MSRGGETSQISARYPKDRRLRIQSSTRNRKNEEIVADCVGQFAAGNVASATLAHVPARWTPLSATTHYCSTMSKKSIVGWCNNVESNKNE